MTALLWLLAIVGSLVVPLVVLLVAVAVRGAAGMMRARRGMRWWR